MSNRFRRGTVIASSAICRGERLIRESWDTCASVNVSLGEDEDGIAVPSISGPSMACVVGSGGPCSLHRLLDMFQGKGVHFELVHGWDLWAFHNDHEQLPSTKETEMTGALPFRGDGVLIHLRNREQAPVGDAAAKLLPPFAPPRRPPPTQNLVWPLRKPRWCWCQDDQTKLTQAPYLTREAC